MDEKWGWLIGAIGTVSGVVFTYLTMRHKQRMEAGKQDADNQEAYSKARKSDAEIQTVKADLSDRVFRQMEDFTNDLLTNNRDKQKLIDDMVERDRLFQAHLARLMSWANKAEERNSWLVAELKALHGKDLDLKPMPEIPQPPAYDDAPAFRARSLQQNTKLLEAMKPASVNMPPKGPTEPNP